MLKGVSEPKIVSCLKNLNLSTVPTNVCVHYQSYINNAGKRGLNEGTPGLCDSECDKRQ